MSSSEQLSVAAATNRIREWHRGFADTPIAYLTGGVSGRRAVFDGHQRLLTLIRRAESESPLWVRVGADGLTADHGEPAEWLDRVADTVRQRRPLDVGAAQPFLVLIDDRDAVPPRLARSVFGLLGNVEGLLAANVRVLVGVETPDRPADGELHIRLRATQLRHALLDEVTRWATDPLSDDVLLVTGPPGVGKSVLCAQAVDHLAEVAGVRLAYHVLRDPESPGLINEAELVAGVAGILREQGIVYGTALGQPDRLAVTATSEHSSGSTIGAVVERLDLHVAQASLDTLVLDLDRRARAGDPPVIVLVVDAIDELLAHPQGGADVVLKLLTWRDRFATWRLKLLLAAQSTPPNLAAETIELVAYPDVDITEFAMARLAPVLGEPAARAQAEHVRQYAQGLFLVADDVLSEFEITGALPSTVADDLVRNGDSRAARHVTMTLERRGAHLTEEQRADWPDLLRFLTLACLTPQGLTDREMSVLWEAPSLDGTPPPVRWPWGDELRKRVADGTVRRYLRTPDDAVPRYRAYHPAVRDGVLALAATDPLRTVDEERERFVRALTPLDGGPPWDSEHGRLAIAATPAILNALIDHAVAESDNRERQVTRVRRLVEGWRWLEACATAPNDPDIPLGIRTAIAELRRLADTIDQPTPLWADGLDTADPTPAPTTAAAKPVVPSKVAPAKKVAWTGHPMIAAAIGKRYDFPDKQGALIELARLARIFALSKWRGYNDVPEQIVLYIRGFGITAEREEQGYRGYLARIAPHATGGGRWTLRVEPLADDVPISALPDSKRRGVEPNHSHPHWGHPVLRAARRNTDPQSNSQPYRPYASWEAAMADLQRLHRDYSNVSIPGQGFLYLIVYEGRHKADNVDKGPATHKIVLHIVPHEHGGFVIRWRDNEPGEARR